jgi:hypothetical protein
LLLLASLGEFLLGGVFFGIAPQGTKTETVGDLPLEEIDCGGWFFMAYIIVEEIAVLLLST